jgi:hypothetical protein
VRGIEEINSPPHTHKYGERERERGEREANLRLPLIGQMTRTVSDHRVSIIHREDSTHEENTRIEQRSLLFGKKKKERETIH